MVPVSIKAKGQKFKRTGMTSFFFKLSSRGGGFKVCSRNWFTDNLGKIGITRDLKGSNFDRSVF